MAGHQPSHPVRDSPLWPQILSAFVEPSLSQETSPNLSFACSNDARRSRAQMSVDSATRCSTVGKVVDDGEI